MNNRMTRFMILQLWVLFIFQIRISSIQAYPSKVGCTLIGSSSNSNVMTRTSNIMGATPNDVSNLISFSSNTYSSGGQQITVTISNLKSGGAVIHSDKGTLTKPSNFDDKGCSGTNNYYSGVSTNPYALTLTVPSDISNVDSIKISVITAAGYGTISRQAKSLAKGGYSAQPSAVATASVADGTGITITATIARTESQRCIALLASASNPTAAAVTAGTNAQGICLPLQVKLVDHHFRLHVLVLLQALHTKYGVQLTQRQYFQMLSTPVAQVYSAQPSAVATASVADSGITVTATARTESQRCSLQMLLILSCCCYCWYQCTRNMSCRCKSNWWIIIFACMYWSYCRHCIQSMVCS